jgi:hypothetical protein
MMESLATAHGLGDKLTALWCLEGLAAVAELEGRHDQAARLYGAAEAGRERLETPATLLERDIHEPHHAAVRAALGEPAFAAAWAEGRAMPSDQVIQYALEEDDPERSR